MRESPSIVPTNDQDVYLVLDDYGEWGTAWRETDVEDTDLESVIIDLLEGQYINPVRVVGFNVSQGLGSRRLGRRGAGAPPTMCRSGPQPSGLPATVCRQVS